MAETVAAPSLVGYRPACRAISVRVGSFRRKSFLCFREKGSEILGVTPKLRVSKLRNNSSVMALATELTQGTYAYREKDGSMRTLNYLDDTVSDVKPRLWPPENVADNTSLHNPLLRQERMGCGWLGAIFEWEGVIVEDNHELEKQSWVALSQEEGKSAPPEFVLRRIEGMKNEQAISEALCWSRDPVEMRRMAARKEEIYQDLQSGIYRLRTGSKEFVNVLMHYKIPMALVSTRPRKTLETAMGIIGMLGYFDAVVAAEDVQRGKPDPEMFIYASQLLNFIPERCIVFGDSNQTVEAAHEVRMKCVAVASKHPVYELTAADLVVRHLDELSVVDLKNLADIDSPEFSTPEPELEVEHEEPSSVVRVDDCFW